MLHIFAVIRQVERASAQLVHSIFCSVLMYFMQDCNLYLIDTLIAVYLNYFVLATVVVHQMNSLFKKYIQPLLYRLSSIISTLIEFTTILVTHKGHARWMKNNVVNVLVGATDISTG